jgi:catechol 2,3-dioxygenase-like lactoylglutathione lyase family enzyme
VEIERREMLGILTAVAGSALLPASLAAGEEQTPAPAAGHLPTERVTGIGGFFFRAKDPKALSLWYQDHLGVVVIPQSAGESAWKQEAGATAFQPFPEKTSYFGDPAKQWMINFRVRDLDKMAKQLESAGIEVKVDPTTYPNGRFASLHDPEGNPIQLWQPM